MTLNVFPDLSALSLAVAEQFVLIAQEAVAANGRFLVALSGGGTPEGLFHLLATPAYAEQVPWPQTHVFWSDERLVPPDAPGSNYRQAHDALLQHVAIPPSHIYRAKGELLPETAVSDYSQQLRALTPLHPWPQFDLILLGMGSDGHTASLFPGPIPEAENSQPIIAVTANYDGRPAHRITFTPLLINAAHHIFFLVAGANKQAALTAVRHHPHTPEKWPAQRIRPTNGSLTWFADSSAVGN